MSQRDPTCIGRVRHVVGSSVTVALDNDLAGIAPLYRGQLLSVGQIGSLVRIPQGLVDLIASVSLVGIAELAGVVEPVGAVQRDERWLQVQLLGEIDRATGRFQRGVGSYPALDDSVHFATADQLVPIFPPAGLEKVRIGCLSAAETLPVCLDAARLVMRHAAVVGSTGSGKTSSVASLLQAFVKGGWASANIVVVDPHGEYARAMGESAQVLSVLSQGDDALQVPFWTLPALEILRIFSGGTGGATYSSRFSELVAHQKRKFCEAANWLDLDPSAITPDTPVPFDIHEVWFALDSENRETLTVKADPATKSITALGSAAQLRSTIFSPYGQGAAAPFKGQMYGLFGSAPDLLRLGLLDPRLQFFLKPEGDHLDADPLEDVVLGWLGSAKPVSILDFSGVSPEAADAAIGVVLNLVFELAVRTLPGTIGIGRESPVLIVLEEAHRYLGSGSTALTRDSANRIAREGRKYGVGLWMVTQRPTELPETALAQCGTLISLRLTNSGDQGTIRAALPDSVAGLAGVLPALRTGEAIVSGEAVVVPCRALLDKPSPMPLADDPNLATWRRDEKNLSVAAPLKAWRGVSQENSDD